MRESVLNRDVLPHFSNRRLPEITVEDLRTLCDRIKDRGAPATAVHARDVIAQIFVIRSRILVTAQQPGQIGYSIIDSKAIGRFMPPVFPGEKADTLADLARKLNLPEARFMETLTRYNEACRVGTFDHTALDDCHTDGIAPPKTHWARPIDTPPYYGYALRPGITFTYLGLKTNDRAQVHFGGEASDNLFVAGEMMAGNVLGKGYTAGVGMSIGTAFGRIAGTQAARAAFQTTETHHAAH